MRINRIAKIAYDKQERAFFSKSVFISELKRVYLQTKREYRGDVLIPFSKRTIDNFPVSKDKEKYKIKYKWNQGKDAEFAAGSIIENACIKAGSYIDRIGSESGEYVSPCSPKEHHFSISERALPYFFVEETITQEPAFHRYHVLRDISTESILEALDKDDDGISQIAKEKIRDDVEGFGIKYGKVAPVAAFRNQGKGLGLQYKLPVSICLLRKWEFIEDEI